MTEIKKSKMPALGFGIKHGSCVDAREWRKSLGVEATQADAYLACDRGDWLLWQLRKLPVEKHKDLRPKIRAVMEKIITRAIRRGIKSLRGIRKPWAADWCRWGRRWINGTDRSAKAAEEAAAWAWAEDAAWAMAAWAAAKAAAAAWAEKAAAWAAEAKATEEKRQAREIRKLIPVWPGE